MTINDTPVLYSFRRCPYAMRARMALLAARQQVQLREIVLRDKPDEMLAASPKATVPVLVLPDDSVLEESLDIMLWALRNSDPENWLSPESGDLDAMLELITEMDGDFKHHLDHYKYATRHVSEEEAEAYSRQHRSAALAILEGLDARLATQPYLFGARRTLADVAIAPFVRQFANTDIDWFNAQPLPHLQKWLRAFLADDLFVGVMPKFKPWKETGEAIAFPPTELAQAS